jgi:hypothetical protein
MFCRRCHFSDGEGVMLQLGVGFSHTVQWQQKGQGGSAQQDYD